MLQEQEEDLEQLNGMIENVSPSDAPVRFDLTQGSEQQQICPVPDARYFYLSLTDDGSFEVLEISVEDLRGIAPADGAVFGLPGSDGCFSATLIYAAPLASGS